MRFWTSDLHFSHGKMLRERSFKTLEKHDSYLVKRWNKQVKCTDEVWILGDLSPLKFCKLMPILERLNGTKKLVVGNHDLAHPHHLRWEKEWAQAADYFAFVGTLATVRVSGTPVMMNHFPFLPEGDGAARFKDYRISRGDRFLLHGHTHRAPRNSGPGQLHVGWDAWDRLVTEKDVRAALRAWRPPL